MGRFAEGLDRFAVRVKTKAQLIHEADVAKTYTSIVFGSELTGAPGQPVGPDDPPHEHLRESWKTQAESPTRTAIFTESPYAKSNEDGIARPGGGPYRLLSPVGGRRSVALTKANFDRIHQSSIRDLSGGA